MRRTLPSSARLPRRSASQHGSPQAAPHGPAPRPRRRSLGRERGGRGAQAGAAVALGGRAWANRTLFSQAYQPRHQSLLNGQTYYVTVQATSRTASRLTANATSAGVKARPRPALPSRGACLHPRRRASLAGCPRRCPASSRSPPLGDRAGGPAPLTPGGRSLG
jgi:hypothetical protein